MPVGELQTSSPTSALRSEVSEPFGGATLLLGVLAGVPEGGPGVDTGGIPRAAAALGHRTVVVAVSSATVAAVRDVGADAWITRFAGLNAGYALSAEAESAVAVVLNRSEPVRVASDQLATLDRWRRCGLPIPLSIAIEADTGWTEAADRLSVPLVVKRADTTGGSGVHLVATADEFARVVDPYRARGAGLLGQHFLGDTAGRDLRIMIVGGMVVAAMRRQALREGEWRANLQLGGHGVSVNASHRQKRLALAACAAVGLDVAGVDLLDRPDGRDMLLEINSQPGRRIERVCGVDVPAEVVRLAEARLQASRSSPRRAEL